MARRPARDHGRLERPAAVAAGRDHGVVLAPAEDGLQPCDVHGVPETATRGAAVEDGPRELQAIWDENSVPAAPIRWNMIPPSDSLKATNVALPSELIAEPQETEPGSVESVVASPSVGMRRSAEAVAATPRRESRVAATARASLGSETSVSWFGGLGAGGNLPRVPCRDLADRCRTLPLRCTGKLHGG